MMKMFKWVTKDTNFDFMKLKKLTYALSLAMTLAAAACIAIRGFNYGIDFAGGILIEVKADKAIDIDALRERLSGIDGAAEINLQTIGEAGDEAAIRTLAKDIDEKEQMKLVGRIKAALADDGFEFRRVELVGPQVGDELKLDGVLATVVAILALSAYIWVRFEWQFALGALVGLAHDIVVTLGLLSLFDLDFTLTTMAAVLTLAGYSINDTVVTFDRIRENLRKFKKMEQKALLNKSINDILSRTILTGLTTLFASAALLAWGGDALRPFAFTITWGIVIGTYSSIYVCTAFLDLFNLKDAFEEKRVNPFEGSSGSSGGAKGN